LSETDDEFSESLQTAANDPLPAVPPGKLGFSFFFLVSNRLVAGNIKAMRQTSEITHDSADELADAQLLLRFVQERDDAAFAALVERYSHMVWGICKRILVDHHAAEDAFQATFLVLARRAAVIEPRHKVASWLFGVARKTALKLASRLQRQRLHEQLSDQVLEQISEEAVPCRELQAVIDEEISRLPEKHRLVLLLCDIGGKTRQQAASELGVPEGSVAGWQARGRAELARRLVRRGMGISSVAIGAMLARTAAASQLSQIPGAVLASAQGCGAVSAVIPTSISVLAGKVISMMFWAKVKMIVVVGVTLAISGGLVGWGARSQAQSERPQSAGEAWRELVKQELSQLEGKWVLTAQLINGQPPGSKFKRYRLTITTEHKARLEQILEVPDQPDIVNDTTLTLSLNPAKKTKEINFYGANMLVQGIYQLEEGTLKIAHLGISEADRPQSFVPAESGSTFMPLITLEFKRE
jgi:RNA polymerase sigma factor (sigma-70 family)